MSNFEWYGNIPKNWNVKKGKYLYKFIQTGKKDSGENNPGGKYPFFTCSKEVLTIDEYSFDREALLVAGNGIVGETKYYNGKFDAYQRVYVISDFTSEIFVPYLTLYMTNNFIIYLTWRMIGSVINFVKLDDIKNFDISYPVYQTQMKIANFLENKSRKIEDLIMNQQQQIEKLKEYKQSLICEVVTKGLDQNVDLKDSGIQWVGMIPRKWSIDRLKYVASSNDESLSNTHNSESLIEYVDIGSVSQEKGIEKTEYFTFNEAPSRARRMTKINDILVSTVRTYLKAIAVVDRDNLIASTGFSVIRPNNKVNNAYLSYYIKSDYFTELVSAYSNGISYPAINDSVLMSFYVIKPPLNEQEKISVFLKKKVTEIDKMVSIKEEKIEKLNEYKKSLIYEYVTGKKEVS